MDFALDSSQQLLVDSLDRLLEQHAGPARAIALGPAAHDDALAAALVDAGYDALALELGPLAAVLAAERVARAAGAVSAGASLVVAPLVFGEPVRGPVALVEPARTRVARFAPMAACLLVLGTDAASAVDEPAASGGVEALESNFGFPFGRVSAGLLDGARPLAAGAQQTLACAWRLALAAEIVGAADAALTHTRAYLSERRQFGQPIAAFQAVAHRLAQCAVRLESTRWLLYETADRAASDGERCALLSGWAAELAALVHGETHQLSGAIGFTREHDLHVWSMRLKALELELGGADAHYQALTLSRWPASGA